MPRDRLEEEAERFACSWTGSPTPAWSSPSFAASQAETRLATLGLASPGLELPQPLRGALASRFGDSVAHLRVHTGPAAQAVSRALVEVCSHHLHTRPEPPLQRLGTPLPAKLEALILACLEKDPTLRPVSAAALRVALRELADDLGPWSEDAAREWWERWRRRRPDTDERGQPSASG